MTKLHLAIGVMLAAVVLPQSAMAGFETTYSDWNTMGETAQSYYSEGLLDQSSEMEPGADNEAFATGLRDCATKLDLTGAMIADAITRHYVNDTSTWGERPTMVFWHEIVTGACFNYINTARLNRGLTAWKKN